MSRIRIVLVDDHKIFLDAVSKLIEREFDVVGSFQTGRELLEKGVKLRPDVIVMDIGMPEMNGLLVAVRLNKLFPYAKLVFLTMNRSPEFVSEAFQLGASAYILKNASGRELMNAIRIVVAGETYTSPGLSLELEDGSTELSAQGEKRPRLTTRQKEILQLLTEGLTMKDVSIALKISAVTVAYHKYTVMRNYNIDSSAGLLKFARSVLPMSE